MQGSFFSGLDWMISHPEGACWSGVALPAANLQGSSESLTPRLSCEFPCLEGSRLWRTAVVGLRSFVSDGIWTRHGHCAVASPKRSDWLHESAWTRCAHLTCSWGPLTLTCSLEQLLACSRASVAHHLDLLVWQNSVHSDSILLDFLLYQKFSFYPRFILLTFLEK
jgi:hypothetical protein